MLEPSGDHTFPGNRSSPQQSHRGVKLATAIAPAAVQSQHVGELLLPSPGESTCRELCVWPTTVALLKSDETTNCPRCLTDSCSATSLREEHLPQKAITRCRHRNRGNTTHSVAFSPWSSPEHRRPCFMFHPTRCNHVCPGVLLLLVLFLFVIGEQEMSPLLV